MPRQSGLGQREAGQCRPASACVRCSSGQLTRQSVSQESGVRSQESGRELCSDVRLEVGRRREVVGTVRYLTSNEVR